MPIDRTNVTRLVEQLLDAAEREHPNAEITDVVLVAQISEDGLSELRMRYGGSDPSKTVAVLQGAIATYVSQRGT
jgi:hypothetical protein